MLILKEMLRDNVAKHHVSPHLIPYEIEEFLEDLVFAFQHSIREQSTSVVQTLSHKVLDNGNVVEVLKCILETSARIYLVADLDVAQLDLLWREKRRSPG